MPLRDHFRLPTTKYGSWESLHGMWPAVIVQQLRRQLPPGYVSTPRVNPDRCFVVDPSRTKKPDNPAFAPPRPTWFLETDVPEDDEYEVEIFNTEEERRLVAVIEIVSPANKDRVERRRAFVAKCAALLRRGVAVSVVDLVTIRRTNLYAEVLAFIGHADPTLGPEPPATYAASCRWLTNADETRGRLEGWSAPMAVGEPLPALPIWLDDDLALDFDLDRSYEQACSDLGFA